jgi:hypothetical protein
VAAHAAMPRLLPAALLVSARRARRSLFDWWNPRSYCGGQATQSHLPSSEATRSFRSTVPAPGCNILSTGSTISLLKARMDNGVLSLTRLSGNTHCASRVGRRDFSLMPMRGRPRVDLHEPPLDSCFGEGRMSKDTVRRFVLSFFWFAKWGACASDPGSRVSFFILASPCCCSHGPLLGGFDPKTLAILEISFDATCKELQHNPYFDRVSAGAAIADHASPRSMRCWLSRSRRQLHPHCSHCRQVCDWDAYSRRPLRSLNAGLSIQTYVYRLALLR